MSSRSGHSHHHHQHHHHPKLKPPTRALFSCGMFRNCTQTALSPTAPTPPPPPPPPSSGLPPPSPSPPPPPPPQAEPDPTQQGPTFAAVAAPSEPEAPHPSSSSSSSSSTSQSFTQWRFPLTHPLPESEHHHLTLKPDFAPLPDDLPGAFRAAELHLASGSRIAALRLLERSLVHDPGAGAAPCPTSVMSGVVASVLDPATARPAAKVLLALLLAEGNRRLAVEAGAATAAVEAVAAAASAPGSSGATTAERALAALELVCTVPEGAAEVRRGAGAVVGAVERLGGRGRECAIGVLAAIYGGEWAAEAAAEVGRTVVVALQGECSARGRRKGAQLLKALKDSGRLDLPDEGC